MGPMAVSPAHWFIGHFTMTAGFLLAMAQARPSMDLETAFNSGPAANPLRKAPSPYTPPQQPLAPAAGQQQQHQQAVMDASHGAPPTQLVPGSQVAGSQLGYMARPQPLYHPQNTFLRHGPPLMLGHTLGREQPAAAYPAPAAYAAANGMGPWAPAPAGYYPVPSHHHHHHQLMMAASDPYMGHWQQPAAAAMMKEQRYGRHLQPPSAIHQGQSQQSQPSQYQPLLQHLQSVEKVLLSNFTFPSGSMVKPRSGLLADNNKAEATATETVNKIRLQRSPYPYYHPLPNRKLVHVQQLYKPIAVRPIGPVKVYQKRHPGRRIHASAAKARPAAAMPMRMLFNSPTTANGLTIWEVAFGKKK